MDSDNNLPLVQFGHWISPSHSNLLSWVSETLNTRFDSIVPHFLVSFSSPHTRRNYRNDLVDFARFLVESKIDVCDLALVTPEVLNLWRLSLMRDGKAQKTCARKLACLSALFRFAEQRKLLSFNPMDVVTRGGFVEGQSANVLTALEMKTLLDFLHSKTVESAERRSAVLHFSVLYVLFTVGMRVDELCELRIQSFNSAQLTLELFTKGSQRQIKKIHPETSKVILSFIQEFRLLARPSDPIFCAMKKEGRSVKLSQSTVYRMVSQGARDAGLKTHISPHSCRATFATLLHNASVPLLEIQKILGHRNLSTTSGYISRSDERDRAAALKIDLLS